MAAASAPPPRSKEMPAGERRRSSRSTHAVSLSMRFLSLPLSRTAGEGAVRREAGEGLAPAYRGPKPRIAQGTLYQKAV